MRSLALVTAATLVTALLPTAAAGVGPTSDAPTRSASAVTLEGDPEALFDDVPHDHPFAGEIGWLVEQGITTGYADGTFRPGGTISRQAFAAFLFRLDGQTGGGACTPGQDAFADVPATHPFCQEITWLADNAISTGYADGTFRPGATISRQALAAFLHRYDHPGTTAAGCEGESPFTDVPASSPFCEAIRWMSGVGITTGYSDGTFGPGRTASRQAMAAYLFRYREHRPIDVDSLEYVVSEGTLEAEPGDVLAVDLAADEIDPEELESGNVGEAPGWSATVHLDAATAPQVGQALVIPPGDPVHPNGLAGRISGIVDQPDGSVTVVLDPVPLDEVFDELTATYSGPVGDGVLDAAGTNADPDGEGDLLGALTPRAVVARSGVAAAATPAAGALECRNDDGYVVGLDVATASFGLTFEHLRGTFVVRTGLLVQPYVAMYVTAEPVVTISAEATVGIECKILPAWQNAHRKVVPLGVSGATLSIGPSLSFSVDGAVKYGSTQRLYWQGGFQTNTQGLLVPIRAGSADPLEFEASGGVNVSVDAGMQIQLGYLDRVGAYGKAGPSLSAGVEVRYDGFEANVCAAYALELKAALGAFLDVWVARWEHEVASFTLPLRSGDLCMFPIDGPGNPGGPGGPGDPGDPGEPEGAITAVSTSPTRTLATTSAGQVLTWGEGTPITVVPGVSRAVDVAVGNWVSFAIDDDGILYAWGEDGNGRLGLGPVEQAATPTPVPGLTDVTTVSVADSHVLAVAGGEVWAWGYEEYGQLGDGGPLTGQTGTPQRVPGIEDAIGVEADHDRSFAWTEDGTLYAWGRDFAGNLGLGASANHASPATVDLEGVVDVAAGSFHTLAILDDQSVWGWGAGAALGPDTLDSAYQPVQVSGIAGALEVAAGDYFSVAVTESRVAWTWGGNDRGQLGDGTDWNFRRAPQVVGGLSGVSLVAAGGRHAYAVTDEGLVTWGDNLNGQQGDGGSPFTLAPAAAVSDVLTDVVDVAAGNEHSLALTAGGDVYAWGYGGSQSGWHPNPGRTIREWEPQLLVGGATAISARGSQSLALVDDDGTTTVLQWGSGWGRDVEEVAGLPGDLVAVAAGGSFGLALTGSGQVYAWGDGSGGQLGTGAIEDHRQVAGPVPGLSGVTAIAAGDGHALALLGDGTVRAWGSNLGGELGLGTQEHALAPTPVPGVTGATSIGAGRASSYAGTATGTWVWGDNAHGMLGTGDEDQRSTAAWIDLPTTAAAGGRDHSLWLSSGQVWAAGYGWMGLLGIGVRDPWPSTVPVAIGLTASRVAAGWEHSLAVFDGTVYGWGQNGEGQLGPAAAPPMHRRPVLVHAG